MEKSKQAEAEPLMSKAEKGDIQHVAKVDLCAKNAELDQVVVDGRTDVAVNNVQNQGENNNVTEEVNDIEMENLSETSDIETEKDDLEENKGNCEVSTKRDAESAASDEGFYNVNTIDDDDNVCENDTPIEASETLTNDDEHEDNFKFNVVRECDDKTKGIISNDQDTVRENKDNETLTEDKDYPDPKTEETLVTLDEEEQEQSGINVSEMCQTETDNTTVLPGQITDSEESMVWKRSLKRQMSRRSVTFSEDEKTDKNENIATSPDKRPIKPRKSRMQILDEIASAATEAADDFDSIGKNRLDNSFNFYIYYIL